MDTNTIITIISILIGSGLIQFFVNRKDKKDEDKKVNDLDILRKEFREGLDEREKNGKYRFDVHENNIAQLKNEHNKNFLELKEAILKLTENDAKITQSLSNVSDTQKLIADSLLGLSHDKIIFVTDKIAKRGAITVKEQATLESMYNPYSALGGNGHCAKAMEYVSHLPIVSDEEARELDSKN